MSIHLTPTSHPVIPDVIPVWVTGNSTPIVLGSDGAVYTADVGTDLNTNPTSTDGWIVAARPTPHPIPTLVTETISVIHAEGRTKNALVQFYGVNAKMKRQAVGQWAVSFGSPHPLSDKYAIIASSEEQGKLRDLPSVTIVQGSISSGGFKVQITTGDNSSTADTYVDTPWSFAVTGSKKVVVDVVYP